MPASPSNSVARLLSARSNEMLDQLQAQLRAEHAQHAFNVAELEKQIAALLRELAEARLELARRDSRGAFAGAEGPSPAVH